MSLQRRANNVEAVLDAAVSSARRAGAGRPPVQVETVYSSDVSATSLATEAAPSVVPEESA